MRDCDWEYQTPFEKVKTVAKNAIGYTGLAAVVVAPTVLGFVEASTGTTLTESVEDSALYSVVTGYIGQNMMTLTSGDDYAVLGGFICPIFPALSFGFYFAGRYFGQM